MMERDKECDKAPASTTGDTGSISDGYHTFDELYDHRVTLWIKLCECCDSYIPWRSELHSDGSKFEGWFLLGMGRKAGTQMTYHIPMSRWNETHFADDLECAPEFDGHTSADVLERIKRL